MPSLLKAIPHQLHRVVLLTTGNSRELDYLIRAGDNLPKGGTRTFRTSESLKAGSAQCIRLKLFEGDIQDTVDDNRLIGTLKIIGTDIDEGVVPRGAEIVCQYEMLDSGNIILERSLYPQSELFLTQEETFIRGKRDRLTLLTLLKP